MKKPTNGQSLWAAFALSYVALLSACQSTPTPTAAQLKRLQGHWVGVGSQSNTSITITGNSLHYHSGTDFWFKTTFTLPAGTDPQQLRATIRDCGGEPPKPIGKVVLTIFKIEDGTLTLANYGDLDADEPPKAPKSFADERNQLTVLRKVQPPEKSTEPPKTK